VNVMLLNNLEELPAKLSLATETKQWQKLAIGIQM
jgi:hypothetical protein